MATDMQGMDNKENDMKRMACFIAIMGLLGLTPSAVADPEESQRLRGLGGRSFAVEVTALMLPPGPDNPFTNCYTFNADGSWDDPLFLPGAPVPGTWNQDSTGAATSYTATAIAPIGGGLAVLLTQVGTVTPANGRGTLQLDAFNTVDIVLADDPETVVVPVTTLTSVGAQDDTCAE